MATAQTADSSDSFDSLPYANLQLRIVAFILDVVVIASGLMVFAALAGLQILLRSDWGRQSNVPDSVIWPSVYIILGYFVLVPLYFIAFWAWRGQSLGMMAVRIQVLRRDGRPLTLGRAIARSLAWPLSLLPLGLGFVTLLFDPENRALHDYLAGTTVVELP